MTFRKDLPIQSRRNSLRIGDDISGGADPRYSFMCERLHNFNRRATNNIMAAIARLEAQKNVTAINVVYLDGIEVREGEAYYVRRANFQIIPKTALSLVK